MKGKRIVIGGWYNPVLDDKTAKKIKDCGLDFLFLEGDNIGNNCLDNRLIEALLDILDGSELTAYVQKGNDVDIKKALESDEEFSKHVSYLGMLMYDEPSAETFDRLSEEVKRYASRKTGKIPFINLLPSYARSDSILGNYNAYITEFCEKFINNGTGTEYLSFDFYPLIYGQTENLCLADRWLHDAYIVSMNAKRYNVRANAFIQAMPFSKNGKKYGSRERIPCYEDLSLQVYVYLAFGFTSLTYFCLGTPKENFEFSADAYAIFDKDNQETPTYHNVKRLNEEIKLLSDVYCEYEWVDTKKIGDDELFDFAKDIEEYKPFGKLQITSDGKLLIGEFAKNIAEKAVMLVNFGESSETQTNHTQIVFNNKVKVAVYRKGRQTVLQTDSLSLAIKAGEGVFITYEAL